MKRMVDIPMRDLTDVRDWHQSQVRRFEALKVAYLEDRAATLVPRRIAVKVKDADRKIEFHRSIAKVVDAAIMSELRVQAALL